MLIASLEKTMECLILEEVEQIKKRITENVSVNDHVVCGFCDELIALAKKHKDWKNVAYGYVWRADYFFYVEADLKRFSKELDFAKIYIDENLPSELLEKYYTLKHLFYESTFDMQSAFRYVLKALDVAEKLGLTSRVGANYGNIGAYYMDISCYEEALLYTKNALETLQSLPDAKPLVIRLILANLVAIELKLDNFEMAKQALINLSKLPIEEKNLKIYIDYGYLLYYSKQLDVDNSLIRLDAMFEDGLMEAPKAFAFEFLSTAIEAMLCLKQKDKAKYLLDLLGSKIADDEPDALLTLCKLNIKYAQEFDCPELLKHFYEEYYTCFMAAQEKISEMKVEGLYAKVELGEVSLKNDKSQKELWELSNLANYDELTKVYNRRFLNIRQEELLNSHQTSDVGFAFFDIDYFKEYNDYNGHLIGDQLLQVIANLLKCNLTDHMAIFRYGGDEFVCLSWDKNPDALETYVKGIQSALIANKVAHHQSLCADYVTLSIGYGNRSVSGRKDLLDLFDDVDRALYAAKHNGRNCIKSISDIHTPRGDF